MVNTGVSEIVRPGIGTNEPLGLIVEELLGCEKLLGQLGAVVGKTSDDIWSQPVRLGRVLCIKSPLGQPGLGNVCGKLRGL